MPDKSKRSKAMQSYWKQYRAGYLEAEECKRAGKDPYEYLKYAYLFSKPYVRGIRAFLKEEAK